MSTTMSPEHLSRIRLWVDALRSGEYAQARERLRNDDAMCCLGVSCDIYAKHNPGAHWDGKEFVDLIGNYYDTCPPFEVMEWFGFEDDDNPIIAHNYENGYPHAITAINANDTRKWTFAQIADAIEAMYLTPNNA